MQLVLLGIISEMLFFRQALKNEDTECLKVLLKATTDTKKSLKRCSPEACLLPVHGTGKYNYRYKFIGTLAMVYMIIRYPEIKITESLSVCLYQRSRQPLNWYDSPLQDNSP